jgi:hypothetical protein
MVLCMSRPWKHPKTGVYYFRKVVPDVLRGLVGSGEVRKSLGTKTPREAALVMLERDRRPQLISVSDIVGVDGLPTPLPPSQGVSATVWASGADVAVVYGASSSWSEKLFVADFDAGPYHGGFFADLAARLRLLAKACHAQMYFVLAPAALIRHIEPHGLMVVEIPPWFDPAETLLFAAACIKSGRVKFCQPTIDKMATHPLGAALSFKADDPVDAALQGAFLAAIALKFDEQLPSKPKHDFDSSALPGGVGHDTETKNLSAVLVF